ncbi:carbohydrate porin [Komagataeibacter kakiaceti]|uniref:carbohydrate porin n=1 Tax=Komagataeibacter kakiaceti TaxID=943261 RepID=UPI0004717A98|nr:carbohydrate porin [Komagataeibacter kakiaceti]
MRVPHESVFLSLLRLYFPATGNTRRIRSVLLQCWIAGFFGFMALSGGPARAASSTATDSSAAQTSQGLQLPLWLRNILGEKTQPSGPPQVSNPTPYAETQPTTPSYEAIPSFLNAPYGPPSFGPPFGTTHMLGDWGGIQPWLQKRGLYFAFDVYEDIAGNVAGGKKQDYTAAGQVGSTLDVDWDKLLHPGAWARDLWLHLLVVNGNGRNLSRIYGDNDNQVQQIYGSRGNVVAHLVWAYFEKAWLDHKVDLSVGWIPTGVFFQNSPWVCNFMNVWLCGAESPTKYLTGARGWPSGNIGTILRLMPVKQMYVMGGLFAVSPHPYNGGISGWSWGQDGLGKLSTQVEIGWLPAFGRDHLVGHYKLGGMYDNSRYNDLYEDINGNPWVISGLSPRKQSGQASVWVIADQMLIRRGAGELNGLVLGGYYAYASGQTSQINHTLVAVLMDTGALWHRPLDSVGIAFLWSNFSRSAIASQELAASHGLALPGANFGVPYGIQGHETIYEAYYGFHVLEGLSIKPDFQYVNHVGGTTVFKDAVVLSTAVNIAF